MTTNLKEWIAQVERWKEQYGVEDLPRETNLTFVGTCCFRCGKHESRSHRHHTGNDMIFARMLPDHYARNYVLFRREDWERLCESCHKAAHRISKETLREMWAALNQNGTKIITVEWCESWRQKLKSEFYEWCKRYKPRLGAKRKKRRHR